MKKKKILLLSDDLRMHSGIATQSKELVMGTLDKYDWAQVGAAISHPDNGKIIDMTEAVKNEFPDIKNPYLKVYPSSGYGSPDMLREIMAIEKPDAIFHFTDPRFWIWLYNMEHEIRQNIPIFYLNIWDDLPDPLYNTNGLDKYKFKILFLNRNIRRKQPGDVALAYKHMMDKLTPEQRKECVFVWHSQISDENGTDMRTLCQTLLPDYPVIFTHDFGGPMNDDEMNFLYNSVDVYINLASNEGFGLGSLESLHAGTPIVVNVTGGLQDQCGFKKDGKYLTEEDYVELGSNHRGEYKEQI